MKDGSKKYQVFSRRVLLTGSLKLSLLGLVMFRFHQLQVTEREKYSTLSDKNRIKIFVDPPHRGIIKDRNGVVLVSNKKLYCSVIEGDHVHDAESIIPKIDDILGYSTQDPNLSAKIKEARLYKSQLVLNDNLSWSDIVRLEMSFASSRFNGFDIVDRYRRYYNFGDAASHLLGYVSKPSKDELGDTAIPNYREFRIGKNGAEKEFEDRLQGAPNIRQIEVNAVGKKIRNLSSRNGQKGDEIKLALDISMQQIVDNAMKDKSGVVIIMEPHSGEILSMNSTPKYDPNEFIDGIHPKYWKELISHPDKPLMNKAILTAYPPGSIFKLVDALAFLNYGVDLEQKVLCQGYHVVGDRVFHCWKDGGHGYVNFYDAVAHSCNVYFYVQGAKVGISNIHDTAVKLGLGQKTGIQLPFEISGVVPNQDWKQRRFRERWQLGDTLNTVIGQGYTLVTPIQMVTMLSRIITGKYVVPQIELGGGAVSGLETGVGAGVDGAFPDIEMLKGKNRQILLRAMHAALNRVGSTGYKYRVLKSGIEIAGKSGTAQVVSKRKDVFGRAKEHGLFVGFAPYDNPKYVISVVIEHGGWGASSAIPVAHRILNKIL